MQPEESADIGGPQSHTAHLGNSFRCQQGGTTTPKYPHLGQAIIRIIYLHSLLSSPPHRGQKLFLLISHKWHCPAQLIIIQALWLSWLIGMRVHWSICLRISSEAPTPPISQSLVTYAVRDRYCRLDLCGQYIWNFGSEQIHWKLAPGLSASLMRAGDPKTLQKKKKYMLTSPSGCRRWGRPGSDSKHKWRSPEQWAVPLTTPSSTLRG